MLIMVITCIFQEQALSNILLLWSSPRSCVEINITLIMIIIITHYHYYSKHDNNYHSNRDLGCYGDDEHGEE